MRGFAGCLDHSLEWLERFSPGVGARFRGATLKRWRRNTAAVRAWPRCRHVHGDGSQCGAPRMSVAARMRLHPNPPTGLCRADALRATQDSRGLRHPPPPARVGQAFHHHRSDRVQPPCVLQMLDKRRPVQCYFIRTITILQVCSPAKKAGPRTDSAAKVEPTCPSRRPSRRPYPLSAPG